MALVNVDTDLLRALIYVVDTGSFTQAAERLFRTQSAVSLQIKKLEELVTQQLLIRDKKRVTLTPSGHTVYRYALQMLKLNDELITTTKGRDTSTVIRFGAPDDYQQLFMPRIIKEFTRFGYDVEYQIFSDLSPTLSKMVDNGDLDIALITDSPGVDALHITSEPLSWVCATTSKINFADVVPLALFPEGCTIRELALAALHRSGLQWRIKFSSNQFAPLKSAIIADQAIGILPTKVVPTGLIKVPESCLPTLPNANIVLKISPNAAEEIHQLASTITGFFAHGASVYRRHR